MERARLAQTLELPASVCAYHLRALVGGGHVRTDTSSSDQQERAAPEIRYIAR